MRTRGLISERSVGKMANFRKSPDIGRRTER